LSKSSGRVGTVRVFIADGSRMSCQLIAAALRRGRYRTRVVGYATDAIGIREGLGKNEADVAVIGARLEEEALAGFNVTREIRASNPKPSVIMILDSSKPTMVVEAFRAGASGVFSRDQSSELNFVPMILPPNIASAGGSSLRRVLGTTFSSSSILMGRRNATRTIYWRAVWSLLSRSSPQSAGEPILICISQLPGRCVRPSTQRSAGMAGSCLNLIARPSRNLK
jgi:DNA-binding NarL/FixJ family response regulator